MRVGVSLEHLEFAVCPALYVLERNVVDLENAVLCACFDSHVCHAEAVVHRKVLQTVAGELHGLVQSAVNADHSDDVQYNVLAGNPLAKLAGQVELDSGGNLEPRLAGSHSGSHISGAYTGGKRAESAVCTCVAVRADHAVGGYYKSFFREERMLDPHVSYVVVVHDVVFICKAAALLALLCRLDVFVRGEVIHYKGDLRAVKNAVEAVLLKFVDSDRAGDIVAEHHVQLSPYELPFNNTVKPCMLCEDLLCHRHTHNYVFLLRFGFACV